MASSGNATSMSFLRGAVTAFPYHAAARRTESTWCYLACLPDEGLAPGAGPLGGDFNFGNGLDVL